MVKKSEFSKMWEDSYLELFKPWIDSTGEIFKKTAHLSKEVTPKKYREFYDEWIKTYQNTFGKFYPIPTPESNKETLEKFLLSAEGYNKLYRSWIEELEDNSRKTKEIFGNYMVIPDIYSESFLQMSKLWKKSYEQLCRPLNEHMMKLSGKMAHISRGDADPETYKEFYTLWMDTYNEIYSKYIKSAQPTGEMFGHFIESSNIYLGMYKSWIAALEKISEKAREMSTQTSDPEAFKEFTNLWLKMYEKAFDSFFEDMPTVGRPMKEAMEPVKIMAKMYADTFIKMSRMWVRSDLGSASAYPGKNKK